MSVRRCYRRTDPIQLRYLLSPRLVCSTPTFPLQLPITWARRRRKPAGLAIPTECTRMRAQLVREPSQPTAAFRAPSVKVPVLALLGLEKLAGGILALDMRMASQVAADMEK